MTKCLEFHSNSQGVDEIKGLPISIDFQAWNHGAVTFVQYYVAMVLSKGMSIISLKVTMKKN